MGPFTRRDFLQAGGLPENAQASAFSWGGGFHLSGHRGSRLTLEHSPVIRAPGTSVRRRTGFACRVIARVDIGLVRYIVTVVFRAGSTGAEDRESCKQDHEREGGREPRARVAQRHVGRPVFQP